MDLTTTYLGLDLANPLVASASPMTGDLDTLLALQQAGIAAVVLPSLFEEQVEHETLALDYSVGGMADHIEAHDGYFPALDDYNTGVDEYIDQLARAKRELAIPVIASLNGTSRGGWTRFARTLQDEGADALELNVYYVAADADETSQQVEDRYLRLVESVRAVLDVPLAVKIGPFFSSPVNVCRRLADAGADGIVLFNRFYQPDIDLGRLEVGPQLDLSRSSELRLVLRWTAIMHGRVDADLAATTGVHEAEDVVKLILAGSQVTMMASALLRNGADHVARVLDRTRAWFVEGDYESIAQARGSLSQHSSPDPAAFERANYMKTLVSYTGA